MATLSRLPAPVSLLRRAVCEAAMCGLLLGMLLAGPGSAEAAPQLHPAAFALPATLFPAGSQIVRSGVESNRQLFNDDPHHFEVPPVALGRRTGYYMDAIEGDPAVVPHAYTSYLVSMFHSVRQAQMAYNTRWDSWFEANYYTSPAPAPVKVGDGGEEALFHSLNSGQAPFAELFFRRGAVLVEVFQGTTGDAPTAAQLHSFYSIARALDRVARAASAR